MEGRDGGRDFKLHVRAVTWSLPQTMPMRVWSRMAYFSSILAPGAVKEGLALVVRLGMSGLLSLMVYSILLPVKLLKTMAAMDTHISVYHNYVTSAVLHLHNVVYS